MATCRFRGDPPICAMSAHGTKLPSAGADQMTTLGSLETNSLWSGPSGIGDEADVERDGLA